MIKKNIGFWIALVLIVSSLLFLPVSVTQYARGTVANLFSPVWDELVDSKLFFNNFFNPSTAIPSSQVQDNVKTKDEEIHRLRLEQQLLMNEIQRLQELYQHEHLLYNQLFESLGSEQDDSLSHLMDLEVLALPARVIYRAPGTWTNSLWINVGSVDNEHLGKPVVAMNSPVLLGTSVVGVIEFVGKNQSRVKLITDPALTPSVRAVRGSMQNKFLAEHIDFVLNALIARQDILPNEEERESLSEKLYKIKGNLLKSSGTWHLAKGEMQGSKRSAGKVKHSILKGTGFNYDFADEKGPARDLRTGKTKDRDSKTPLVPLLKVSDLLITTGMDGVFPPGLRVGTVTAIQPLKEGDYYYELEAKPAAGDLDELSLVFVIPPLSLKSEG